jgi:hypothetical protein
MIEQRVWIRSHGSTMSAVMVEVECGSTVLYSRKDHAERGLRKDEKIYHVVISINEVPSD